MPNLSTRASFMSRTIYGLGVIVSVLFLSVLLAAFLSDWRAALGVLAFYGMFGLGLVFLAMFILLYHGRRRSSMKRALLYLCLATGAVSGGLAWGFSEEPKMKAQLTIYVAPPLIETGGTVIVVANPIPLEKWQNLADGENAADADPANEKRKELKPGDRLFGVTASTKVSIIEFVYPEGGTFGFNFTAMEEPHKRGPPLRTKEILIGDGGYTNWKTGEDVTWDYVSVIHVLGPTVSEGNSRGVDVYSSEIMNLQPQKTVYEGAVLYSPTDEQVDKAVIEPEEQR